jgi:hypothetical protein
VDRRRGGAERGFSLVLRLLRRTRRQEDEALRHTVVRLRRAVDRAQTRGRVTPDDGR